MKIVICADTFYPKLDGMSTSTQALAAELARLGHQVIVIAPKSKTLARTPDFSLPGVRILWQNSIPAGFYPDSRLSGWSPATLARLNRFEPDVVHAMSPLPISLNGLAYAHLHRLPAVMTFHTYFMDPEYLQVIHVKYSANFVASLGWDIAKTIYDRAHVIIAPTDSVADDLRARHFREPIFTIPSGVTTKLPPIDQAKLTTLASKYKLNPAQTIITVGRVSPEKNLSVLLDVFARVARQLPAVKLAVIGDGPQLTELQARCQADQLLHERVVFTGAISHDALINEGYYHLGKIFVTASLTETQGMTALEAQMAGLPVVAFAARGLPYVINQAGKLVAPDDQKAMAQVLVELLTDDDVYRELAAQISGNLARFDIETTTRKVVAAYNRASEIVTGQPATNLDDA